MKPDDYKLSQLERETIIIMNEKESTANVFSCSQSWVNRIKKLPGAKPCGAGYEVDVPKAWIKFPKPPSKKTEAQLEAARRGLKRALANRKK